MTGGCGGDADDRLVEPDVAGRSVEVGVAVAEDAAVGCDEPVAVTGGCGGHADDRLVEPDVAGRSVEVGVAVAEDAAVGCDEPVAPAGSRRDDAEDGLRPRETRESRPRPRRRTGARCRRRLRASSRSPTSSARVPPRSAVDRSPRRHVPERGNGAVGLHAPVALAGRSCCGADGRCARGAGPRYAHAGDERGRAEHRCPEDPRRARGNAGKRSRASADGRERPAPNPNRAHDTVSGRSPATLIVVRPNGLPRPVPVQAVAVGAWSRCRALVRPPSHCRVSSAAMVQPPSATTSCNALRAIDHPSGASTAVLPGVVAFACAPTLIVSPTRTALADRDRAPQANEMIRPVAGVCTRIHRVGDRVHHAGSDEQCEARQDAERPEAADATVGARHAEAQDPEEPGDDPEPPREMIDLRQGSARAEDEPELAVEARSGEPEASAGAGKRARGPRDGEVADDAEDRQPVDRDDGRGTQCGDGGIESHPRFCPDPPPPAPHEASMALRRAARSGGTRDRFSQSELSWRGGAAR